MSWIERRLSRLEDAIGAGRRPVVHCVLELHPSHDAWSRSRSVADATRAAAAAEHEARTGERMMMVRPPRCANYKEWAEMRRQFQERARREQA